MEVTGVTGKSDSMQIHGVAEEGRLFASSFESFLSVAVAVNGNRNSKYAVKWALEKFVPEGRIFYKLLHIHSKITMVPTPMGNYLPISKVREEVVSAYRKELEWKTNAMLLPYKQMCAERQVQAEVVIIESDDVADSISEEVTKCGIDKLVVGAPSQSVFTRKLKGGRLSSKISASAPSFCTVYVVSKGKLSSVRSPAFGVGGSTRDDRSNSSVDSRSLSSETSCSQSEWTETDPESSASLLISYCPLAIQRDQALKAINRHLHANSSTIDINQHRSTSSTNSCDAHYLNLSLNSGEDCPGSSLVNLQSGMCTMPSCKSFQMDNQASPSFKPSTSDNMMDTSSFSDSEVDITIELDKLRIELGHLQEMCKMAQNETTDASHELNELSERCMEENQKLQEISSREQKARELVREMKEKREAAKKEAGFIRGCAEQEVLQRKDAETSAAHVAEEKQRLEKALSDTDQQYRIFEWQDILSATSSFSHDLRLGGGANGTVYKGCFHHMKVAVKVLHSNEGHGTKQFKQELEVLTRTHHPHLLLLLGACPDHGCLVYEYMENGSLDDRLQRKNGEPSLRWFDRFRITWEVASALVFLHNSKPKPIVHRDLKPANILLDHNLVSKIGDVGLSALLPFKNTTASTLYKDTAPVGTFCYIDPEYQRTGMLSLKSDVYALGMVMLQLLTAKPPMGLAHIVEMALENDCLVNVLDSSAGEWPLEETQELALLGLRCAELRRRDRPDLQGQVLPALERLKSFADRACSSSCEVPSAPPSHFICPILQEVMDDPCVAADGYTYDRRAIEIWLSMNDKSPLTNLQLPSKTLVPNHTLFSAIKEWKSRN
uniref:RING-type E3 ubiquitin transferase n=1 Tax=Anthurium amnicola TaxID=1678845 RepID=A0A1D1ZGN6_9ARAE